MATFKDIFKSDFLKGFDSLLTAMDVAIALMVSFLISLGIYLFYKLMTRGAVYSKSFNIAMSSISVITTVVIMAVRSNVILSLGMVGALSIVRFRTAIKDPMDLIFLFWSIAVGIVVGAGDFFLALSGSAAIAVSLFIHSCIPSSGNSYLVIADCATQAAVEDILKKIKESCKRSKIKSSIAKDSNIEVTVKVALKKNEISFVQKLKQIENVNNVILLSHDGES